MARVPLFRSKMGIDRETWNVTRRGSSRFLEGGKKEREWKLHVYLRLSQKLSALNSIEFSFFSIVKFVSNPRTTRIFEWNEKYGKTWTFHVINGLWSTRKNIIPFLISFFWKKKKMKLSITKEVDCSRFSWTRNFHLGFNLQV